MKLILFLSSIVYLFLSILKYEVSLTILFFVDQCTLYFYSDCSLLQVLKTLPQNAGSGKIEMLDRLGNPLQKLVDNHLMRQVQTSYSQFVNSVEEVSPILQRPETHLVDMLQRQTSQIRKETEIAPNTVIHTACKHKPISRPIDGIHLIQIVGSKYFGIGWFVK